MSIETVKLRAVSMVAFQREADAKWETGVAVLTSPGLRSIVCIIPTDATTSIDVVGDVYKYQLLPYQGCFTYPVGVE